MPARLGVVYEDASAAWHEGDAAYLRPSAEGRELWTFALPVAASATACAVACEVNGVTYWDSAGGANYHVRPYAVDAILAAPLGGATGQRAGDSVTGEVLVQNRGFGKAVGVVYTDDGWASVKSAPLRYEATLPSGIEVWTYAAPLAPGAADAAVTLAFHATFQGSDAWDSAFAANYRLRGGVLVP